MQGDTITFFFQIMFLTMIKAFGRCGDLAAAFAAVDEMQREKYGSFTLVKW